MRVGLDARRLQAGRGLDRYVCELVTALSAIDHDTEYLLLTGSSPVPDYVRLPRSASLEPAGTRLRAMYRPYMRWWGALRFRDLDLFHFPTGDVWYSRYCRAIVNLPDLAPLKYPRWFFNTAMDERRYQHHLNKVVTNAALLLTLSEYTKQDIVRLLGMPDEKVVVSYAGVNTHRFAPLSAEEAQRWLAEHVPVTRPFLLYVGALEPRKNVHRIVEAFLRVEKHAQLVLVGSVADRWRTYMAGIEALVADAGAQDRVQFARVADDYTLRALYSSAAAFVFPSIDEGFGLPPLEAMACGTAVITSSTTSLPEVVGDAAVQVHPEDTDALSAAMVRLLEDAEFRSELVGRGPSRARCFPWSRVRHSP
jgi:glycosyltransferase involved in cell wall biosynthesis